uniref:fructokinase n=1 Tax=Timspurckia oligopyrenoides TaxID=708627 RepID=A0A7S0ZEP7_9RHOD|mmetsp:Transcript_2397/g.4201  ORF Transcript_2397/g.4201 Transcript_2397/m.4201 type:complete len:361 (+) Transcript_2397:250-1332(+)|eukprot:CAMPEP_0182450764 /NCGR_PEP_ID=MMETSP1172-20130603/43355_1 /TAXON_ID=708627 /ORGANISM="Timspurckia oligopyrenoides, Strain CCMP3278" /LENGTH=360 /DNA_ID=CAMNT_0024648485 /DNA_START=238 /DNA_END=1320 /DNA_ORIENTATION=+
MKELLLCLISGGVGYFSREIIKLIQQNGGFPLSGSFKLGLGGSSPRESSKGCLLGAIELGGTTSKAAVSWSSATSEIIADITVPTEDPETTLSKLVEFLVRQESELESEFAALGVGSFGPIDIDPLSESYGCVTSSPKILWRNFNVRSRVVDAFPEVPVGFDTDVNAPALAEIAFGGHGEKVNSAAYITVGTGVGVGVVVDGRPVHGLMHPEGGHITVEKYPGDTFVSECLFHGSACELEAMVCAEGIARRCGVAPENLKDIPDEDPVWNIIAYYLAALCINITYLISPQVIVISGGIMKRTLLYPLIREHFQRLNAGYVGVNRVMNELDKYIVPSKFGYSIGVIGTLHIAERELKAAKS